MIFKFRMLSDEDDNFVRDYEIAYDATIKDLHHLICENIGFSETEMCSIFLCDEQWMKLREFTLMDMGMGEMDCMEEDSMPIAMEKVLLGHIIQQKFARLLFVFDLFEDRAFFIEMLEAKEPEDGMEYPRTMFENGFAPNQFDASKNRSNRSIFEEAMDDFEDFNGDDEYDDEYF